MKIAVIGGGGVRSPFLAKSISQAAGKLGVTEVAFSDIDPVKLDIYGKMAKKTAYLNAPELKFTLTTDNSEAISGADYIITTIRPGGDGMRRAEESLTIAEGVIAQETVGAAGLSFAMRTYPALEDICLKARSNAAENFKIFNFTNPVGIVTEALAEAGYDFQYGICDAPTGMLDSFEKLLGLGEGRLKGEVYGLNHLSFFASITLDGRDVTDRIINDPAAYEKTELAFFEPDDIVRRGYIPNEYLYYYFYPEKALRNMMKAKELRGAVIERLNRAMTEELIKLGDTYKNYDEALKIFSKYHGARENAYMSLETGKKRLKRWAFDPLSPEKGGYASVALRFIEIEKSDVPEDMILSCPSRGALDCLKSEETGEFSVTVSADGVVPHRFENIPEECADIIFEMKKFERAAAQALRFRSKSAVIKTLSLNPLVPDDKAEILAEKYIELNRPYVEYEDN